MAKKTMSNGRKTGGAKAAAPRKIAAAAKPRTKGEIFTTIAEHTELSRKQVAAVFETFQRIAAADLGKGTVVQLPGMAKFTVKHKPATKAREGINPFTKEKQMFKAKPASKAIRVRPLKNLKAMV